MTVWVCLTEWRLYERFFTDIHEKDLDYLARSRAAAEHCAEAFGWRVVECEQGGEMKSVESIAQAVLHALQDLV